MMALAKVSWEDRAGVSRGASAKIEDTSRSGACIRIGVPIRVGSKLEVAWRDGKFSGITKYCRAEGGDYVLGIQRDTIESIIQAKASRGSDTSSIEPPASTRTLDVPVEQKQTIKELPISKPPEAAPEVSAVSDPQITLGDVVDHKKDVRTNPEVRQSAETNILKPTQIQAKQSSPGQDRTIMLSKWLHLSSKNDRKDVTNGNANSTYAGAGPGNDAHAGASRKSLAKPQGDLLPLEDIYRATGISTLRMGYSINKVIEMLNSDHLRELSSDIKRASVLMALDAAGISVDEVLKDAKLRVSALNSYEAGQQKHLEEYEAGKVRENAEIQLEMERVTAHYLDRMKRNMDEVAQVRTPFSNWQTMKQQEAQRFSEAMALCVKRTAQVPPGDSQAGLHPVGVTAKPSEPVS
jgi:hypothetical protein